MRFFVNAREMGMRFRHAMSALMPFGAASALAVLPVGASTAAHATTVTGHVTPAVSSPLAYKFLGKAYDIPTKLTGAGQTIVIIDAFGDPTLTQDLGVEDSTFGLPAANLSVIYPNGQPTFDPTNADEVNWSGEIALDVESAHAVAPAAKIDLVVAKSDQDADILSALKYVVAHRLGSVLSQSFGEAESCEDPSIVKADHVLFAAAAAQGMTVFASSGDNGAAQPTCDGSSFIKSAG